MRLLLDTRVFLWIQTEPERLAPHLPLLKDPATELLLSAVSAWEIAIKHGLGRLPLPEVPERWVPRRMRAINAQPLAITHDHALGVAALPPLHRDPFDRLLVAQVRALDIPLLTADVTVASYPVKTLLVSG